MTWISELNIKMYQPGDSETLRSECPYEFFEVVRRWRAVGGYDAFASVPEWRIDLNPVERCMRHTDRLVFIGKGVKVVAYSQVHDGGRWARDAAIVVSHYFCVGRVLVRMRGEDCALVACRGACSNTPPFMNWESKK